MLILFNTWQMRKIQFESVVTVRGFRGCLKKCWIAHTPSVTTAWSFLEILLYSKVAKSRTHGPGKTAISHLAKAPVINFWPNQDAKKAKRWMMKPHPVISKGHTINFSRDLKAPRPGFNTRNVFGTLKISTTVKHVVKQMSNHCHLWVTDTWKVQQQQLGKVSNIPLLSLYFNYKTASRNL